MALCSHRCGKVYSLSGTAGLDSSQKDILRFLVALPQKRSVLIAGQGCRPAESIPSVSAGTLYETLRIHIVINSTMLVDEHMTAGLQKETPAGGRSLNRRVRMRSALVGYASKR